MLHSAWPRQATHDLQPMTPQLSKLQVFLQVRQLRKAQDSDQRMALGPGLPPM